jgi:preprotein translocase subunit SecF
MSIVTGWKRLYHGESEIGFVSRRRLWFTISAIVLLVSIGSLTIRGLNFGIEFSGGVQISAPISDSGPLADASGTEITDRIRSVVSEAGASGANVQVQTAQSGERTVQVQTESGNPRIQRAVVHDVAQAVGTETSNVNSEQIGSTWGGEITSKAVKALIIFFIAIVAFISWRFEWKMAAAALLALVHDLLITAGVYSLVGFEVTPSTVVAILTILGYSLYDTVVVFDKVEENTAQYAVTGRMTYSGAANLSMNEVFMRSLNTSLSTLLPTAALLFIGAGLLGASTLEDLALALLVGILSGTYSSIFVATPFLTILKEREPRFASIRSRLERSPAGREEPAVGVSSVAEEAAQEGRPERPRPSVAPAAAPAGPSSRPHSARGRAGAKKRRRRRR